MPSATRRSDAQEQVHRRADGEDSSRGGQDAAGGGREEAWRERGDAVHVAEAVRDNGCAGREAPESSGGGEWPVEAPGRRARPRDRGDEGNRRKKMVSARGRR